MKPFFSDKENTCKRITLIEKDEIISNDGEVAEIMNEFFSNAVSKLDIKGYHTISTNMGQNKIQNAINKFRDHPSILNIKQRIQVNNKFIFTRCNPEDIMKTINNLNIHKSTTFNNIPVKLIVATSDICSPPISTYYNDAIINCKFPEPLKMTDITPVYKKKENTNKSNYRPVSILREINA